ncbi:hypothetical protein C0Q70_19263 [Pomacea canaliculata]|uniref:Uncharacterized protein n=1 Tax=Pomacea canaliculata TaxID=400727 RepID=A0A2T7NIU6_POMCA|nr:hypothetical protein C0Q70_19263 [Pomacea canaliculata]
MQWRGLSSCDVVTKSGECMELDEDFNRPMARCMLTFSYTLQSSDVKHAFEAQLPVFSVKGGDCKEYVTRAIVVTSEPAVKSPPLPSLPPPSEVLSSPRKLNPSTSLESP